MQSASSPIVCPHCLHELAGDGPCRHCGIVFRRSDWKNRPEAYQIDGLSRAEDGSWFVPSPQAGVLDSHGYLNPASVLILDKNRTGCVLVGSGHRTKIRIDGADNEVAAVFHVNRASDDNDEWWIHDTGTASGVRINGSRHRLHRLRHGDIVEIAGVHLQYFAGEGDILAEFVPVKPVSADMDIVVRNLSASVRDRRTWQKRILVDGVSFSAASGEMIAILGPSGCGKTTLLRRIAGLAEHDGEILFAGRPRHDEPEFIRKKLAYLPQSVDQSLSGELTLTDEVRCQLRMFRSETISPAEVVGALRSVNLSKKRKDPIREFSGGEKRRAAVALARLRNARILLLDEPTAGLDPASETDMVDMLRSFVNAQRGIVICSTHVLQSVHMFDKVLVLGKGGRMRAFGPPAEVLPKERNALAKFYRGLESVTPGVKLDTGPCWSLLDSLLTFCGNVRGWMAALPGRIRQWNGPTFPAAGDFFRCMWAELERDARKLVSFRRTRHPVLAFFGSPLFLNLLVAPAVTAWAVWFSCRSLLDDGSKTPSVFFCCILSLFLLGMFNAIRKLVAPRIPGRCLERLAGVPLSSTLCAISLSLGVFSIIQTCVFLLTLFGLSASTDYFHLSGWFFPILFVVAFTGSLFGLVLSALSKDEMSAMRLAPIAAIFILFFSQPGIGFSFRNSDEDARSEVRFTKRFMPTYRPQFLMDDLMYPPQSKDKTEAVSELGQGTKEITPFMAFLQLYGIYCFLFPCLVFGLERWRENQWDGC